MDVENRKVFVKSFGSLPEKALISRLENNWIGFDEIKETLGLDRCRAERWVDALTLRCSLAEKRKGKFLLFKIVNEQDFLEENK